MGDSLAAQRAYAYVYAEEYSARRPVSRRDRRRAAIVSGMAEGSFKWGGYTIWSKRLHGEIRVSASRHQASHRSPLRGFLATVFRYLPYLNVALKWLSLTTLGVVGGLASALAATVGAVASYAWERISPRMSAVVALVGGLAFCSAASYITYYYAKRWIRHKIVEFIISAGYKGALAAGTELAHVLSSASNWLSNSPWSPAYYYERVTHMPELAHQFAAGTSVYRFVQVKAGRMLLGDLLRAAYGYLP